MGGVGKRPAGRRVVCMDVAASGSGAVIGIDTDIFM